MLRCQGTKCKSKFKEKKKKNRSSKRTELNNWTHWLPWQQKCVLHFTTTTFGHVDFFCWPLMYIFYLFIFFVVQLICKADLWRIIHHNVNIICQRLSRLLNLRYTLSKQAAALTVSSQQVAVSPVYPTTAAVAVWSALHSSVEFFVKSDQTALAAGEVQCINVGDLVPWAEKSNEMCLTDSNI